MPKLVDRFFIYLYTWHYEKNNNNPKIDSVGIASWVLGCCIMLWLIVLTLIGFFWFNYHPKTIFYILLIACISLIISGLLHTYYIEKNRAITLYISYKSSSNAKSPIKGVLIVIGFMIIPLIVLALFLILFDMT